jgi:hypothetical protein
MTDRTETTVPSEVYPNPIVEMIRRRVDQANPADHSIPNCDVRLLLLEIDNARDKVGNRTATNAEAEISAERLSMIDAIVRGETVMERWERNTGVISIDDLKRWAESQLREVLILRSHRENRNGGLPPDGELEDYLIGKQAVLIPLLANLRQIAEREAANGT